MRVGWQVPKQDAPDYGPQTLNLVTDSQESKLAKSTYIHYAAFGQTIEQVDRMVSHIGHLLVSSEQ